MEGNIILLLPAMQVPPIPEARAGAAHHTASAGWVDCSVRWLMTLKKTLSLHYQNVYTEPICNLGTTHVKITQDLLQTGSKDSKGETPTFEIKLTSVLWGKQAEISERQILAHRKENAFFKSMLLKKDQMNFNVLQYRSVPPKDSPTPLQLFCLVSMLAPQTCVCVCVFVFFFFY